MSKHENPPFVGLFRRVGRNDLILLALGAGLLFALWSHFGGTELVTALSRPRASLLLVYGILAIVVLLGYTLRWWLVARALEAAPSPARLLTARLAGDAVSALIPSAQLAGEPVRIALVAATGVETPRATAAVALDRMLEWVGNTICAITFVTIFCLVHTDYRSGGALFLFIGVMMFLLISLAVPLVLFRRGRSLITELYRRWGASAPGSWRAHVEDTERHLVDLCQRNPRTVVLGILLSLAIEGTIIVEYHFLLAAFGLDIALPTLLLVLIGSGLARAVPTPGALGALEAGQVGVLAMASGETALGFVVGIVLRLHETLWMIIGLFALFWCGAWVRWSRRTGRFGHSASLTPSSRDLV